MWNVSQKVMNRKWNIFLLCCIITCTGIIVYLHMVSRSLQMFCMPMNLQGVYRFVTHSRINLAVRVVSSDIIQVNRLLCYSICLVYQIIGLLCWCYFLCKCCLLTIIVLWTAERMSELKYNIKQNVVVVLTRNWCFLFHGMNRKMK